MATRPSFTRESIRARDLRTGRKPGARRKGMIMTSVTESPSAIKRASRLIRRRCTMRPRGEIYSCLDKFSIKDTQDRPARVTLNLFLCCDWTCLALDASIFSNIALIKTLFVKLWYNYLITHTTLCIMNSKITYCREKKCALLVVKTDFNNLKKIMCAQKSHDRLKSSFYFVYFSSCRKVILNTHKTLESYFCEVRCPDVNFLWLKIACLRLTDWSDAK